MKAIKNLFAFIFGLISGISASFAAIGIFLTYGIIKIMAEDKGKTRRPGPVSYQKYYREV